ncbi:MAG: ATP-binding cassette domain-containing protein [Bacteroidales bacterium]
MEKEGVKIAELVSINAGYNGDTVLKNVNFEIFDNDFIGIIGPNGGGKTTLVKVLLGLLKPYTGQVNYYFNIKSSEHGTGYLPQANFVDKKFPISVWDVVLSGFMNREGIFKRISTKEKKHANKWMEKTGISHLKKKPIGELSGGQMQRVFLCRSIVSSPKLLILDEPNTYVDNKFESELYELLRELNKSMAILIVSHDVGMISTYIKTIACVNNEVHYHRSNIISDEQLKAYNCPIQLITHGEVPHTVLGTHQQSH